MPKKIQLPIKEHLKAGVQDIHTSVTLDQSHKKALPGIIQEQINLSELSQAEREACSLYQIYGNVNYISPLNRIVSDYGDAKDFFTGENKERTFKKSFEIYVVRPAKNNIRIVDLATDISTESTDLNLINSKTQFVRLYEVLTNVTDIKVMPSAFEKNIFGEQIYNFYVNQVIDMADDMCVFGHPNDELYLYFHYKPLDGETLQLTNMASSDTVTLDGNPIVPGTFLYGDYIQYFKAGFKEKIIHRQEYRIISRNIGAENLEFIYNPFVPVRLFSYEENVQSVRKDNDIQELPWWIKESGGRYYWKDKIPAGVIEENNLGADHGFTNGMHYIHKNINLFIKPDMKHAFTSTFFNKLRPGTFSSDGFRKDDNENPLPNC